MNISKRNISTMGGTVVPCFLSLSGVEVTATVPKKYGGYKVPITEIEPSMAQRFRDMTLREYENLEVMENNLPDEMKSVISNLWEIAVENGNLSIVEAVADDE